MPHAIIEYSANLSAVVSENKITQAVHQAMITSGLFDTDNIKTRAHSTDDYMVGSKARKGSFIHLTISILTGRTTEQRKSLSQSMITILKELAANVADSLTVEIREMDRETYQK